MNERVDKEFEKLSILLNFKDRSNYVWIMQNIPKIILTFIYHLRRVFFKTLIKFMVDQAKKSQVKTLLSLN